jgi:hypothetical protein
MAAAVPSVSIRSDLALRCAIYTRKSTEEGLEQTSNTLDEQRNATEAFILGHRQEVQFHPTDPRAFESEIRGALEAPAGGNFAHTDE